MKRKTSDDFHPIKVKKKIKSFFKASKLYLQENLSSPHILLFELCTNMNYAQV